MSKSIKWIINFPLIKLWMERLRENFSVEAKMFKIKNLKCVPLFPF